MPFKSAVPRPFSRAGSIALAAVLVVTVTPTAWAAPQPAAPSVATAPGSYVVTMAAKPIASYAGGVSGLAATKPTKGRKVNPDSRAAVRYRAYLTRQQSAAASTVGAQPAARYSMASNAFTATLAPDQVKRLKAAPGVLAVTKNTVRKATDDTNNVDFLSLTGSTGVWSALGGQAEAGKGVVVGIIDSGVWPESQSFAGPALGAAAPTSTDPYRPYRSGSTVRMTKADGSTFVGACQTGEDFNAADCNTKLISARFFGSAWLEAFPKVDGTDYLSPRGADGHGTHVGSTAAGDAGVAASIQGRSLGTISGVAPAAKVAVYKALWQGPDEQSTGGATSDLMMAIDAAVADGVDVINYSVGGSSESELVDPIQLAFLSAAEAGIFVAASAGNSGPGAATMDNTAPWLTTVAASTMGPRTATVQLGNKKSYVGISTTVARSSAAAPLVNAASVKESAASTANAAVCTPGTLNKTKTSGRIVVCDRGVVDRVVKSAEVKRAGGVGMLLVNLTDNSQDGDSHSVPTIHLNPPASQAVKTYAAGSGATATLVPGNTTGAEIPYPQIAGFSSRGPSAANDSDVLKPDIAAPGVAVLAAYSRVTADGPKFAFESGTSMSSPQIAGLAALYLGRYPTMAPMSIKSAMMTTASPTRTADGKPSKDAYAQGAGNVRPDRMFSPGVVFTSGTADWYGYLEGQGVDTESGVAPISGTQLNTPSIAVGDLIGTQTVTRRLTAVKPGRYRAAAAVPGFTAAVSPGTISFKTAGETKTVKVKFTRTTAAFGQPAFGSMTLVGAGTTARIPVALTPSQLDAPEELTGTGVTGSKTYTVRPGVSGPLTTTPSGLAQAVRTRGSVEASDEGEDADTEVTVLANTKLARFSVVSDEASADIDLYVYRVDEDDNYIEVGASESGSGRESVTLFEPEAGKYVVTVSPFADAAGTTKTDYTLTRGIVPVAKAPNFTVTPATQNAVVGRDVSITAAWSGLTAGQTYLGYIEYSDGSGTVVTIN